MNQISHSGSLQAIIEEVAHSRACIVAIDYGNLYIIMILRLLSRVPTLSTRVAVPR